MIVLRTPTNQLADLKPLVPRILAALSKLLPGQVVVVSRSGLGGPDGVWLCSLGLPCQPATSRATVSPARCPIARNSGEIRSSAANRCQNSKAQGVTAAQSALRRGGGETGEKLRGTISPCDPGTNCIGSMS